MAYQPVTFQPGVFTDVTEFTAEGRWHRANRIRFRDGLVEPIGGWQKLLQTAVTGIPRALLAWGEIDGTRNLGIGTEKKLLILQGGAVNNVTPIRDSGSLGTDPFTTSNGSDLVTVNDTSHGVEVGATVSFSGAVAFNNVTIDGEYVVQSVTDTNNYVIQAATTANADGSGGGGAVTYSYEINVGRSNAVGGFGWGAGSWNESTWGTPRSSTSIVLSLRLWSLLNWGEDLLASPRGDQLYQWDASTGTSTRAAVVAASPTAEFYVISPEDEHVIALGADGDPLKARWCDQSDFTNWTISEATTAGARFLRHGSRIIGVCVTKNIILIWTDSALFGLQYIGGPFTFRLNTLALRGVALGPNACVAFNDVVYWMGNGNFYRWTGRVEEIPCTVLRQVFDDFDYEQREKVVAGVNEEHHEIWWLYPSASGSGENDKYAKFNFRENVWDYGDLGRTAWIDKDLFESPIAADENGFLYEHEVGYEDDGAALGDFIESGDFDIAESEYVMLIKNAIPDFVLEAGSVDVTFKGRKFPNQTQIVKGPFTVTPTTKKISPRLRARRAAVRFASSTMGTFWRSGRMQVDLKRKGRR